jgi:regulator of protease activity HflC (stomatin/prohibitin superfamily)
MSNQSILNKLVKLTIIIFMGANLTACGFEIVNTGYRGVKTRFGKVDGPTLEEGLHFYNPFTSSIVEMDVRIQRLDQEVVAYTKDVQNVSIKYSVNFFPEKTAMHELYQNVGMNWAFKLIPQILEGTIKEIVGTYEAVKLINNRNKAVSEIKALVTQRLTEKAITTTNFELTNFDFNNAFENAVEAKVIAIQTAEEAKNKTVRIKEEADQKVIAAKAEAESMRIRARALTQNKSLVEYEAVQKWDGKLPEIMAGGGGAVPFINIGKKR